ncbi:alpha/beta hydrolase [Qipengyuania marisflavi]|uniref:Alpha/beta hydrolase n=1 Tax=Qipengyuania marisflavi TaxID=2486356 RepID=A0A5S3P2I8_9SPHN|nr:alpha/beta hydrolase [Qipengyuania marisflavi]TMM47156.1 alpha/beta hydrolase [Qipengyuania marisflavi]
MFRFTALVLSLFGVAMAAPAAAQSLSLVTLPVVYVSAPVVQQVHQGHWISPLAETQSAPRQDRHVASTPFVPRAAPAFAPAALPVWKAPVAIDRAFRDYNRGLAQYGPFRVLDGQRVALMGETDAATPRWFRAMMRDYPGLAQIDMVECPGTRDDRANMQLGRMIRAAGMVTHVPPIGSVRSGAVELFLAGVQRDIANGAEFAVHSWMDDYGREAGDFAPNAPENRKYLDYYREMGMDDGTARAFYDMTNSVPHRRARWLGASDMRRWVGRPAQARAVRKAATVQARSAPRIDYDAATLS